MLDNLTPRDRFVLSAIVVVILIGIVLLGYWLLA
jgi:hypothetical protein